MSTSEEKAVECGGLIVERCPKGQEPGTELSNFVKLLWLQAWLAVMETGSPTGLW